MEPGLCPARAPSQTIRGVPGPPASEFRLRRGTRIRAVRGISCGRGSLKSRRLSRAALPHGGPRGRRASPPPPPALFWGHASSAVSASRQSHPLQPPHLCPAACPPHGLKGSPQRLPGPTGGLPEVLRSHTPLPLTGLLSHTLREAGPPAEVG